MAKVDCFSIVQQPRHVHIEYQVETKRLLTAQQYLEHSSSFKNDSSIDDVWPIYIELSNGKIYGCDFIVSAIGVTPNVEGFVRCAPVELWIQHTITDDIVDPLLQFALGSDGGLLVDEKMRTSVKNIFACGDVCSAGWKWAEHWFQVSCEGFLINCLDSLRSDASMVSSSADGTLRWQMHVSLCTESNRYPSDGLLLRVVCPHDEILQSESRSAGKLSRKGHEKVRESHSHDAR
jgi:hypothetical protein